MDPTGGDGASAATRGSGGGGAGRSAVGAVCGRLVYYHCAVRRASASAVSLAADVLLVLLCSLSILGLLFHHLHISVPVDPLEWQISQEMANSIVASLANTVGAAESVLRVAAATGHDLRSATPSSPSTLISRYPLREGPSRLSGSMKSMGSDNKQ